MITPSASGARDRLTYALLGLGNPAKLYFAKASPVFFGEGAEPGELAIAHAVAANVAAACGVSVDQVVFFESLWPEILRAMSTQECGPGRFTDEQIHAGIALAESE